MQIAKAAGAGLIAALAVGAALYRYYVHVPRPQPPNLRGQLTSLTLDVGGRTRTMLVYVPSGLTMGAPLVLALHGSQSNPTGMRHATGYELERLADKRGFLVVYPAGIGGAWNDCRRMAPFEAKRLNIDDVGFLKAAIERMQTGYGVARDQVFAIGYSNGAQIAFRMIFEAPGILAGAALFGGNLPEATNMLCAKKGPTPPIMLVSGTADPIVPFSGGEASIFGFASRGTVLSAEETFATFAALNELNDEEVSVSALPHVRADDPTSVQMRTIAREGRPFLALYVVEGGGHVVPQKAVRVPRLLGPVTGDLNGPAAAIDFFLGTADSQRLALQR